MRKDLTGPPIVKMGMAAVALAMTGWGLTPVFVKLLPLEGVAVSFFRLWLGFALMAGTLAVARRRLSLKTLGTSVAAGVLFGLNVALFFSALKLTSAANATLIASMQPLMVLMVAGPWFGERVTGRDVAWTFMALGGLVLVVLGSEGIPVWSPLGDLVAFGALLSWCAFFLLTKRLRVRVGALDYMTGVLLGASLVITPLAFVSGQDLTPPVGRDLVWLVFLVLLGNGGHILMTWAHRHVDVSVSSVILLGSPPVAAIASLLVLGEPLGMIQVIGGLIVLAAVGMIARRAAKVAEAEPLLPA